MTIAESPETSLSKPEIAVPFEQTVLQEAPHLYAIAMTITRDPTEAEDVLQDTMLAAWRSWPRLRDPACSRPWLVKICVNCCLQRLRRSRRIFGADRPNDRIPQSASEYRFSGELLDFDRIFKQLSPRQRAVVALHYFHGYNVEECAGLMGCRPGTARSHLARAVARLKKEMRDV
jgi:RNA polymerase sigma-70 factor (ECF subfamily)